MISSAKTQPNFMIAGAPKCGTTALYEYLSSHPQVFLTDTKEPHYYAEDLGNHRIAYTPAEYDALFAGVQPQHVAVGEASACYMHSAVALPRIAQEIPDIKLIIMLRNPAEMVRSFHSDMVWICFEDEPDFERAWHLQEQRRSGQHVSRLCQVPWFLQYREMGMLGSHVERLLKHFPREQVQFFLQDDLKVAPERIYQEALSFLGLPDDGRREFPRVNVSKHNRLQWLAKAQSAVVRALPRRLIAAGKRVGLGSLNHAVTSLNSAEQKTKTPSLEFQHLLAAEFHDDICKLEELLGRRLDSWKQTPQAKEPNRA